MIYTIGIDKPIMLLARPFGISFKRNSITPQNRSDISQATPEHPSNPIYKLDLPFSPGYNSLPIVIDLVKKRHENACMQFST